MTRKLTIISIVSIILISGFIIDVKGKDYEKKPEMEFDHVYWDYGFVPFDYNMVHFYKVKNTGDADLIISEVSSNCDCTNASVFDTLLAPGERTLIRVDFWTTDYYGANVREIKIESNDPVNPLAVLEYDSNIGVLPSAFAVEPKSLFFLPTHDEKIFELRNNTDNDVEYVISLEADSLVSPPEEMLMGEIPEKGTIEIPLKLLENKAKGTTFTSVNIEFKTEPPIRTTLPIKIARY